MDGFLLLPGYQAGAPSLGSTSVPPCVSSLPGVTREAQKLAGNEEGGKPGLTSEPAEAKRGPRNCKLELERFLLIHTFQRFSGSGRTNLEFRDDGRARVNGVPMPSRAPNSMNHHPSSTKRTRQIAGVSPPSNEGFRTRGL